MNHLLISLFMSTCLGLWAILFASIMSRDRKVGQIAIGLTFCAGYVYIFIVLLHAPQFLLPLAFMVYLMVKKPEIAVGLIFFPTAYFFIVFSVLISFQYLLLVAFMIYLMARKPESVHAVRWVVGLSLASYLLILPFWVVTSIQHRALVRELFPLVSLVDRLGKFPTSLPDNSLNQRMEEALVSLELLLDEKPSPYLTVEEFLKRVHGETVEDFIESEGFGLSRFPRVSEHTIERLVRERKGPFRQERPSFASNHADLSKLRNPLKTEAESFGNLHAKSVVDFSFPKGFGYVMDRDHVAGFQSHRFGDGSEDSSLARQKVAHVDLVSLLLHDQPVVYQSDELPRMDQAHSMPTRPLSSFESASLERIKKGDDLTVADLPEGWLMMGAIRNAQQCVKCHGGKRGDLLGAFTYSIRKTEAVKSYRERMAR